MKKKVIIGIISVLVVISGCLFVMFNSSNKSYYVITNNNEEKIMNTNALTMMYETEVGSGEYQVTSDTTWPQEGYVFNEQLSACENGSELTWDDENNRVIMEANTSDKCYVYFDVYVPPTLVEYITTEVYTGVDGENGLYYHDGVGSYTNADQEARDNSYRYAGANPNNYVCFGSDEEICPSGNLYRIIGVFGNQVKLIKHDYAGSNLLGTNGAYRSSTTSPGSYYKGSQSTLYWYYRSNSTKNTWSESNLNTVNLNTNYLNNIGSKWSSLIATTTWQVGGASYSNVYSSPVKTAYNYEVGANKANTTYSAKIGLMYASDYGYAASPANWSTNMGSLNNDTNRNNNWMHMGWYDWTISRGSDNKDNAFYVRSAGNVHTYNVNNNCGVRPSFYLESSVTLVGGTGTQTDPYRLSV